jgi:hypothetical protein
MPGLFPASRLLESKNSKSGSESNRPPDMSVSRMNGGELAEYTGSFVVCMTSSGSAELRGRLQTILQTAYASTPATGTVISMYMLPAGMTGPVDAVREQSLVCINLNSSAHLFKEMVVVVGLKLGFFWKS